jgi:hypothetical protein
MKPDIPQHVVHPISLRKQVLIIMAALLQLHRLE